MPTNSKPVIKSEKMKNLNELPPIHQRFYKSLETVRDQSQGENKNSNSDSDSENDEIANNIYKTDID